MLCFLCQNALCWCLYACRVIALLGARDYDYFQCVNPKRFGQHKIYPLSEVLKVLPEKWQFQIVNILLLVVLTIMTVYQGFKRDFLFLLYYFSYHMTSNCSFVGKQHNSLFSHLPSRPSCHPSQIVKKQKLIIEGSCFLSFID